MISDQKRWKERFGFVSGTLLVWGVAVLQIWPSVAMFQTGLNLHVWTMRIPGEDPRPEFYGFHMLCLVLGLGLSSLILSAIHVALRGLWFGVDTHDESSSLGSIAPMLDGTAHQVYRTLLVLWIGVLMLLPLFVMLVVAAFIERALRAGFASEAWWLTFAAWLPFPVLYGLGLWLVFRFLSRRSVNVWEVLRELLPLRILLVSFVMVWLCYAGALEMCFTVDLSVQQNFVSRAEGGYILGKVRLGGAASDANVVSLQLHGSGVGERRILGIQPLGDGEYVLAVPVSDLVQGRYTIELTYPRLTIDTSYPYLHLTATRRHLFVVRP